MNGTTQQISVSEDPCLACGRAIDGVFCDHDCKQEYIDKHGDIR